MAADTAQKPLSAFEQEVRRIAESPERFKYPRRPFTARGSFIRRCEGCRMPRDFCICRYRTETHSKAEFWVLMHIEEVNKPTNTARLIGDTLPSTRVFPWQRMNPPLEFVELLKDERYQPFIIFPDDQPDYQHRVVQSYPAFREGEEKKTPVFILLDGTWRQARKMFRQSEYLQNLPVLPVRSNRKTRYQLRKPASDQHLCTAEVGIELLEMAGDREAAEVLENYFAVFNQGYAAARRQKQADLSEAMQWLLDYQSRNYKPSR
jgi:DTW domain-containing protein YfiP